MFLTDKVGNSSAIGETPSWVVKKDLAIRFEVGLDGAIWIETVVAGVEYGVSE